MHALSMKCIIKKVYFICLLLAAYRRSRWQITLWVECQYGCCCCRCIRWAFVGRQMPSDVLGLEGLCTEWLAFIRSVHYRCCHPSEQKMLKAASTEVKVSCSRRAHNPSIWRRPVASSPARRLSITHSAGRRIRTPSQFNNLQSLALRSSSSSSPTYLLGYVIICKISWLNRHRCALGSVLWSGRVGGWVGGWERMTATREKFNDAEKN